MIIFNGKKAAKKILLDLKKKIKKEAIKPKLAVIFVGENPASKLFIRNKKRAAEGVGIKVVLHKFKKTAKEKEIIQKIKSLNEDRSVSGIIVQLPLPKGLEVKRITRTINPQKDVDGFHQLSCFSPPLASAILIALKRGDKSFKKKKVLAIVNSRIFGQTLKNFLGKEGVKINYFLRKKMAFGRLKSADVVITVCGCPNLIRGDMVKKGVVLIDGGITLLKNKKVIGDVNRKNVENKAYFLTPVPGGLGPLVVALLLKNVYLAAKNYAP